MSENDSRGFVVQCPTCETRTVADSANEVVEYYRRHHGVTGHDIEWIHTGSVSVDVDVTEDDLSAVVRELDGRYENGVPIGVVAAAMGERGDTVGETIATIHAVRMTGGLWEPRDDYFLAY